MRKLGKRRVGVGRSVYHLRKLAKQCFNRLMRARPVDTRYDKTVESFLSFAEFTLICLPIRYLATWLKEKFAGCKYRNLQAHNSKPESVTKTL